MFMKKIFLLSLALVLAGAGCAGTQTTTQDDLTTGIQENVYSDEFSENIPDDAFSETLPDDSIAPENAEEALGITLPENSRISSLVNNDRAVLVSGNAPMNLIKTQAFFDKELMENGYQIVRSWGVLPTDGENMQSALFRGHDENWALNIRVNGNVTTYEIQRQK